MIAKASRVRLWPAPTEVCSWLAHGGKTMRSIITNSKTNSYDRFDKILWQGTWYCPWPYGRLWFFCIKLLCPQAWYRLYWWQESGLALIRDEVIVPTLYFPESIIGKFNGGRLGVRKRTSEGIKVGYINKEGELVIPYVFDKVYPFMKVSFN